MPRVWFTPQLARFVEAPEVEVAAGTLREVLEAAFQGSEKLRGYVLDEQGHLRKHVAVFIDAEIVRDRESLAESVGEAASVYVLPALSGGRE